MKNITIRKAELGDKKDFAELVLISAPYFLELFGDKVKTTLQELFQYQSNLFSFEHVYFAEVEGKRAGMILGYDWLVRKRESLRTGFLLFKEMGLRTICKFLTLMRFNATIGKVYDGEYYISNIAIYPQYRGQGVGKELILKVEIKAKMFGLEKIVLDVEKENASAINFYRKLGYKAIKEFSLPLQRNKILSFYRMTKQITPSPF